MKLGDVRRKRVAAYVHFGLAAGAAVLGVYGIVTGSLGIAVLDFALVAANVWLGMRRLRQK